MLLFLSVSLVTLCKEIIKGKVVKIADGDTMTVLSENQQIRVRLHGIDCPEKKQDFGTRAKLFSSQLAFGKTVTVQVLNKDRYGRAIGLVILPGGEILNRELLKAGLAWHYKKFDKSADFAALELSAKRNRVGIWSMKNAIAPWEFRKSGGSRPLILQRK